MIIPWRVDVPKERWPFTNWLILVALVVVFALQICEAMRVESAPGRFERQTHNAPGATPGTGPTEPERSEADRDTSRTTLQTFVLDGWSLRGLLGYMWLHGGILHLLGNLWFLWLFGNAVCAKVGNLRYLFLYICLGVMAGIAHLLGSSDPAIGASGAINGIVGMYLVLFFENEITCYFIFWFVFLIIREFSVRGFWMILFWLSYDVIGAFFLGAASNTAYFAHLGGFAAGFAMAWLMCSMDWIVMERYERSLVQVWRERWGRNRNEVTEPPYSQLGPSSVET